MMPVQKKRSKKAVDGTVKPRARAGTKRAAVAKKHALPVAGEDASSAKRVRNYRKHAKKELSEAFPEIVDVLVERAKEGSLTHTKFLFEIGGGKDKPASRESRHRERSLAGMLLEEVAKRREQASEVDGARQVDGQGREHSSKTASLRSEDNG